jgi:hypothetical protein
MVFTQGPSAHLRSLAAGVGFGRIFRSSGIIRFVQGGVVKTFRWATLSQMADPQAFTTEGFLFPLDDAAADSLRDDAVDERTWLEVFEVPRMLQHTIRGRHIRTALRETGVTHWPKGELSGDLLLLFLDCLKKMRTDKEFFKDQMDLANRIISLFERAVGESRSVWLNF